MTHPSRDDGKPTAPQLAQESHDNDPDKLEFESTLADDSAGIETDWWLEATDGQCSESAALFAASQPAPLSIV